MSKNNKLFLIFRVSPPEPELSQEGHEPRLSLRTKYWNRQYHVMTSDNVSSASSVADFPVELADTIKDFQGSLSDLEAVLRPLLVSSRSDLHGGDDSTLTAMEKARLDCLSAFAMNSLVWVWMRTKGINPKDTEVKSELDRVKKTMARLKEIQDQEKRGKVSSGSFFNIFRKNSAGRKLAKLQNSQYFAKTRTKTQLFFRINSSKLTFKT